MRTLKLLIAMIMGVALGSCWSSDDPVPNPEAVLLQTIKVSTSLLGGYKDMIVAGVRHQKLHIYKPDLNDPDHLVEQGSVSVNHSGSNISINNQYITLSRENGFAAPYVVTIVRLGSTANPDPQVIFENTLPSISDWSEIYGSVTFDNFLLVVVADYDWTTFETHTRLILYDISNLHNLQVKKVFNIGAGNLLATNGGFFMTLQNSISFLDVSDPSNIILTEKLKTQNSVWLSIIDKELFVDDYSVGGTMTRFDITDPRNPIMEAQYNRPEGLSRYLFDGTDYFLVREKLLALYQDKSGVLQLKKSIAFAGSSLHVWNGRIYAYDNYTNAEQLQYLRVYKMPE